MSFVRVRSLKLLASRTPLKRIAHSQVRRMNERRYKLQAKATYKQTHWLGRQLLSQRTFEYNTLMIVSERTSTEGSQAVRQPASQPALMPCHIHTYVVVAAIHS